MKRVASCPACGSRVRFSAKRTDRSIRCPRCDREFSLEARDERGDPPGTMPAALAPSATAPAGQNVFTPETTTTAASVDQREQPGLPAPSRRRWWKIAAVIVTPILVIAAFVLVPLVLPKDPREVVLREFLNAAQAGDRERAERFGVLVDPPRFRRLSRVHLDQPEESVTRGDFQAIADLHERIARDYEPFGQLFRKKDLTGVVAKAINQREDISKRAEEMFSLAPRPGQNANDRLFEIAENYGKGLENLVNFAIGGVGADSIAVTFEQVLKEWGGTLDPAQLALARSFRDDRAKWARLLGRDPETIREPGEFVVRECAFVGSGWLEGQSPGEPPRRIRAVLRRFQLGLIDSGWKVWEISSAD